jgi:predicted transcriptional regulator
VARRHALLAVRPPFAEALVEGRKTVEFRRVRASLRAGDRVFVYATAPTQAVVGSFVCGPVVEARPDILWRRYSSAAATSGSFFRSYFGESEVGCAIEVTQPKLWTSPLTLHRIRQHLPDFSPPQSYTFLSESQVLLRLLTRHSSNGSA